MNQIGSSPEDLQSFSPVHLVELSDVRVELKVILFIYPDDREACELVAISAAAPTSEKIKR